jgi:hypothetical protein
MLYSNIFQKVPPFHHNVYASMVYVWMVMTLEEKPQFFFVLGD